MLGLGKLRLLLEDPCAGLEFSFAGFEDDDGVVDLLVGEREREEAESSSLWSEVFFGFLGDLEKKFIWK